MSKRIVKAFGDITLTEVTQSDGKKILSRAYSVRAVFAFAFQPLVYHMTRPNFCVLALAAVDWPNREQP